MRGELDARDKQLGDTVAEIEKLREDQHSLKGEVRDRGSAITTLQAELEKVRGEVVEKEQAIANLKTELAAGEVKQLSFFPPEPPPTPTPEPVTISPVTEPTPEPESNTGTAVIESPAVTGTLTKSELAKHILEKFPDLNIAKTKDFEKIYNAIGDAVRDKDKKAKGKEFSRLFYLEQDCSFKFVGKIGKENRFKLV